MYLFLSKFQLSRVFYGKLLLFFFEAIRSVVVNHVLLLLWKLSCHQWIMTASPLVQMFLCPQMIEDISTETRLVITVCVNCTQNVSEVLGKVFAKINLLLLVRTKLTVTKHNVLAKAPTWKLILMLFLNYIHIKLPFYF